MKNALVNIMFCAGVLLTSQETYSQQNVEFSLSFQGTIGLMTNRKANVEQIFETLHVTKYEGKLSEKRNGFWNTNEVKFDVHLNKKNLMFSIGIREFNWRYNRDSINHPASYGPGDNYAYSKRTYSTTLPFVSAGYIHELNENSNLLFSLSVGYMGILKRSRQKYTGYDEFQHSHYWEGLNDDEGIFKYKGAFNSYAFDCRISADYRYRFNKNLQLNVGLSYYYAQNGITLHHGLYGNMGITLFINKSKE